MLQELAAREPEGKPRRVVFRFFDSPVAILGEERVEGIELVRNELDANERAVADRPTTRRSRAGSSSAASATAASSCRTWPSTRRAARSRTRADGSEPGVYVAGWIKRGPTGVIGTNKKDATETVELLLEDAATGRLEPRPDATAAAVDALLAERHIPVVEYAGWTAIDKAERESGEKSGRPRVKLCSWGELLATAERLATDRS